MPDRTLGGAVRSLVLACLNATLILVLLCLGAGWILMREVGGVTDALAASAADLGAVRTELAALRADIAATREAGSGAADARLSALNDALQPVVARIEAFEIEPEALISHAIDEAAIALKSTLAEVRGCGAAHVSGSSS